MGYQGADMGWSDVGCYGSEIATPNLDALARGGLRFTQFYNTAKCNPSRACLLTGVYAQQCGMMNPAKIQHAVTLGEVLRTAGYRTLWSGKHHGTENPFTRGFDHYFGLRDGACNYFNPGIQRPGEGRPAQKRYGKTRTIDQEEIYQFKNYDPAKVHDLLILDKHPQNKSPGHFPVTWCRPFGTGRVFYTSLGHREDIIDADPELKGRKNSIEISKAYQQHILGGIQWALGLKAAAPQP